MKLRMHQVDVEVNESDEIIISQEQRDGVTHQVVISLDQVEFLHSLLLKAKEEIESRHERAEEEEEEEAETPPRRGFKGGR
jgi:hypothetical protein